jgi:hypothetical protein
LAFIASSFAAFEDIVTNLSAFGRFESLARLSAAQR